jgi:hypothetical protein
MGATLLLLFIFSVAVTDVGDLSFLAYCIFSNFAFALAKQFHVTVELALS